MSRPRSSPIRPVNLAAKRGRLLRIAAGALLDHPLEHAHGEGDAGRLDRLQVDGREQVGPARLPRLARRRGEDRVQAGDALARRLARELDDLARVAELADGRCRARDVDDVAAADRNRRRAGDIRPPDASDQEPAVIG